MNNKPKYNIIQDLTGKLKTGADPILELGNIGFVYNDLCNKVIIKIGDGQRKWSELNQLESAHY